VDELRSLREYFFEMLRSPNENTGSGSWYAVGEIVRHEVIEPEHFTPFKSYL
jgi:hypothetical protein